LEFDPSGERLVSAGNDGQVIVWDCKEGYAIRQRMEGTPAMARVRFSPSGGEIAAVGFDNEVYIMGRRSSGNSSRGRATMLCECRDLRAVSYRDDESLLAIAGRSGDLHLFDVESGQMVGEHPIHSGRVDDLVFARGSNLAISVGEDGRMVSFDTATGRIVRRTKITSGKLFAIAMLNSQLAAVAGSDNVIRIVNIDSGVVVRSLKGHQGSVPTLAATGGYLFSGGFDATLRRWAIADLTPNNERIAETDNGKQRE
jgi:WD40 repeat protein